MTHKIKDREFIVAIKIRDHWRVPTSDVNNICGSFSDKKFLAALQNLKPSKTPGSYTICPQYNHPSWKWSKALVT